MRYRNLLKCGIFKEIQKSVYVFPCPCKEELDALLEYLGLERYVRYIETTTLSDESVFKKLFRL